VRKWVVGMYHASLGEEWEWLLIKSGQMAK